MIAMRRIIAGLVIRLADKTAQPYKTSHVPGMSTPCPIRHRTLVSTAPASSDGHSESTNFPAGPRYSVNPFGGCLATNTTPSAEAANAAHSQIDSQWEAKLGTDASTAATTPTAPIAMPAIPGTANEPAASI